MTKITWTSAAAGVPGQGVAGVRPYAGVVVCPTGEPAQGTGLPIGGFAGEVRGTTRDGFARLRPLTSVAALERASAPAAQNGTAQQSTKNDGTTLGIQSPGRPQS